MTTVLASPTHPVLVAAADAAIAAGVSPMSWLLDDGAQVLRVASRLLVADGGRVLTRDEIPDDVPVRDLVASMRGARR